MSGRATVDVSRLGVRLTRETRWTDWYTIAKPQRLVSPSCCVVSLFLSLTPWCARAILLRPSRSYACTHTVSLGSHCDFLKSLFQARPRTRGELVEARARPPRFFNRPYGKSSSPQAGYRRHRRRRASSYIGATCVRQGSTRRRGETTRV